MTLPLGKYCTSLLKNCTMHLKPVHRNGKIASRLTSLRPWGQSYKTLYTLGRCEIKCLKCQFNEKEKCDPMNMLGSSVLTL